MEDTNTMYFVFYFYIMLFTIMMFIILQIKYINNNDNFRKNNNSVINIKKYFKDIGLNNEEAETMTILFKQLKLQIANNRNFDINEYVDENIYENIDEEYSYKQDFYSKKLYKNIIKNIIKNS